MRTALSNQHGALQVKGDVRLIRSKQFATAYSLRFPRVTRVRFDDDKGPCDTLTHQELLEDVEKKRQSGARDLLPDALHAPVGREPLNTMQLRGWLSSYAPVRYSRIRQELSPSTVCRIASKG